MDTPQLHCEVTAADDGSIVAQSIQHKLIILPDGEAKAFNRNFMRQKAGGGPLHAVLNNLAARIQQGKITTDDAWAELEGIVSSRGEPTHDRWLVGELNGVRVYIHNNEYVMTTRDMYL